jgi:ABC-type uncharacterized transport system permease subunit
VNAVVFDVALTAYIVAAVAALGSLVGRREELGRFARAMAMGGLACHTLALGWRWAELGRVPVATLAEVVSVMVWIVVAAELWIERRSGLAALRAFVLPVVLALGLLLPTGLRSLALEGQASGWTLVHVTFVLVGLSALVLNFGGSMMYILQERQLKSRRPGQMFYMLPPLDVLDRLTYGTLAAGFPFLTAGLVLGVLSGARPDGMRSTLDPVSLISVAMWAVYAVTLAGRAVGYWRGRRAAYCAIAGFGVLLLTLGVGALYQGRHGS